MKPIQIRKGAETEKPQLQRFKEAARALECDDDRASFEKKLSKIAKPKPSRLSRVSPKK